MWCISTLYEHFSVDNRANILICMWTLFHISWVSSSKVCGLRKYSCICMLSMDCLTCAPSVIAFSYLLTKIFFVGGDCCWTPSSSARLCDWFRYLVLWGFRQDMVEFWITLFVVEFSSWIITLRKTFTCICVLSVSCRSSIYLLKKWLDKCKWKSS